MKITDTGIGIPRKNINKIFEVFFTDKGPRVTGLGLLLAHKLVRENKGKIYVQSREQEGATFKLYFPTTKRA